MVYAKAFDLASAVAVYLELFPQVFTSINVRAHMPLLANVRTGLADVGHDPLSILGNLVKVSRSDGSGIEERGDKSDRGSAVREVLPSVVKVDAGGGVDGKEGKCRADCLNPHGAAGDAGKELLEGSTVAVRVHELSGGLAARYANYLAGSAPLDDIGKHDGCDDKLGACIDGVFGVLGVKDGAAANHDIAVILGAEVRKVLKAAGGREGELDDLEAAVDCCLHGLGAGLGSGRAEDSAGADLGELIKDTVVGFHGDRAVEVRQDGGRGKGTGGRGAVQPKPCAGGGGSGRAEGHLER